jgi:ankyrin repeat protein
MMRNNRKQIPLAQTRGVFQPFNYQSTKRLASVLVGADIERTSKALARSMKAETWEKDVYGKTFRVDGRFYNPYQLRGHDWTSIYGLASEPLFTEAAVRDLSRAVKSKVIFFAYESVSSILLLLKFDKGQLVEALVNDGSAKLEILNSAKLLQRQKKGWSAGFYFYSKNRAPEPGSLSQSNFKTFVNDFFRRENAWLGFDGASSTSSGGVEFGLVEGEKKDVLRADLVALNKARVLTKAQMRMEELANEAAEMSNESFARALAPASNLPGVVTPRNRQQLMRIYKQNISKVKGLIKKGARPRDYWLWQAAKVGNERLAFYLIQAGINLNPCPHGSTALGTAIENRNIEIALGLISAGADLNLKSQWSGPPLLVATAQRLSEVVRAMIKAGADVNVKGSVSCGEDEDEFRQSLAQRGINLKPTSEGSLLSGINSMLVLRPPFAEDSTALIVAVRCGYPELVKMFLRANCDTAMPDKDGLTAIDWARKYKNEKIMALLQVAGELN